MTFRVGMYANMTFIEMTTTVSQWAGVFCFVDEFQVNWFFTHQNSDAGTLWFVIPAGDVKKVLAPIMEQVSDRISVRRLALEFIDTKQYNPSRFWQFWA